MEDNPETIVIDLGSGTVKAGFGLEDAPRSVFPNVTGSALLPRVLYDHYNIKTNYVGDGAQARRGMLALSYPIENGMIMDWEALELVLNHTYYDELRRAPEAHPVLISEQPLGRKRDREQLCQLMFETFSVPAYYASLAPLLATYSSGRDTAMVVDIGDGVMTMTPVKRGYVLRNSIRRVNFAGRDLTHYMTRLIMNKGYYYSRSADFEMVRELKEKLCYVALDYKADLKRALMSNELEKSFEQSDGQVITLDYERFTCPEALFKPSLIGREGPGVHELIFEAIKACPMDLQKEFYGNILLNGGSTMFNGFADRLYKEMTPLAPPNAICRILAPPERKNSVWVGGTILAPLAGDVMQWICREEYAESGPDMVRRKCYAGD